MAFHDIPLHLMANFRTKMEILKLLTNVISLDEFFTNKMSCRKLNVAITFDDGYRSWHDYVAPILKDLDLTATFFVSSGFVGQRKAGEEYFLRKRLKNNGKTTGSLGAIKLKRLAEDGFTIGGHTRNHVNLNEINYINELRSEILTDKKELEKLTGKKVEFFAYPFGIHYNTNIDLKNVLQECGYKGAVTTVPGFNNSNTDMFLLHRDLVDASLSLPVFKARVLGNNDGVIFVQNIMG